MSMLESDLAPQHDVPDLIPARMLNEFAYCPRLAYLEWVQGEFADNLDTLEGRFAHRRVDQPDTAPTPDPAELGASSPGESGSSSPADDSILHSRSVLLSAPAEGLIARIDLIEFSSASVVPVDYKRGKVPDIPGNAYEPERVQLCAQGLILRENGYHCEGGILYDAESRRRVSVAFDDELVERTRQLLRQLRLTAQSRTLPPPLVDSPKCPRCSLVGICLPDEVVFLNSPRDSAGPVRHLVPRREDALPLYVSEQGAAVGKSGDELTVRSRDGQVRSLRLIDVSSVCLFGNVQVSAQAIRELSAASIPVCHFSYGGWFHAVTTGMTHKNIELRIAQFAAAANPRRSLPFARAFVLGKIKNARTILRRHLARTDAPDILRKLAILARRAAHASNAATLLGIEGLAAKTYFEYFALLLKPETGFNIDGRNRRPPRDPVNALLSFLYALLVKDATLAVLAAGFDPMLGFFHKPRYGRPSLALDLAEEFRPIIADSTVLTLINNGEVGPESFIRRAGAVALTDAGRRAVLAAYQRRMESAIIHPLFGYRISYQRILQVQARLLGRALLGEIPTYPAFCTR